MTTPEHALASPIQHLYNGLQLNPKAIAAEDPNEAISYEELVARVEALALALGEKALRGKLPPGSHVGLCAQNHIDHLVAHLAIIAGGFVWVPINPKNGAALNQQLMQKSRIQLLLIDDASQSSLDNHDTPTLLLRSPNSASHDCQQLIEEYRGQTFVFSKPSGNDCFGIKFTGGTTGEPKGVVQSHNNVSAVIDNMQSVFDFCATDCNLAIAPLTHGGSHYILPILGVGGRHILLPKPDPEMILEAFKKRGASVSFMPPTLIYKLLDMPNIGRSDFPKLRHLTYSAAPMPPERIAQVIERIGPHLSTVYGQTEAPMTITAMTAEHMQQPSLQTSVGRVCRHSDMAILDGNAEPLSSNTIGEVAVRGEIVMAGYFEAPDKNQEVFRNGWLLTGDLGCVDDEGFLYLKGRSKELIISGGFNVYPAEVENALMELPDIKECAVFGVVDDYWGERVEAAVCLNDDCNTSAQEIRQKVKTQLGDVKTPKNVHFMTSLPRNPVGKVVRRDIKSLIASRS